LGTDAVDIGTGEVDRDIPVRFDARGVGTRGLIRQLPTESAVLGLAAGTIALPFTWALLKIAVRMASQGLGPDAAIVFDVTPDLPIFAFVFGISLTAGILFGLAPAIEASRSGLSSNLRGGTSAVRTRRLQDAFLAAQVRSGVQ